MTMSRLRTLPVLLASVIAILGVVLIHVTGDPDRIEHHLGSEKVSTAVRGPSPSTACGSDGRLKSDRVPNCVDYLWRNEIRYRVFRDDVVRIFTLSDPAWPRLIAMIDRDGKAHVSKGAARTTSEFIFDILLGIVTPKEAPSH